MSLIPKLDACKRYFTIIEMFYRHVFDSERHYKLHSLQMMIIKNLILFIYIVSDLNV